MVVVADDTLRRFAGGGGAAAARVEPAVASPTGDPPGGSRRGPSGKREGRRRFLGRDRHCTDPVADMRLGWKHHTTGSQKHDRLLGQSAKFCPPGCGWLMAQTAPRLLENALARVYVRARRTVKPAGVAGAVPRSGRDVYRQLFEQADDATMEMIRARRFTDDIKRASVDYLVQTRKLAWITAQCLIQGGPHCCPNRYLPSAPRQVINAGNGNATVHTSIDAGNGNASAHPSSKGADVEVWGSCQCFDHAIFRKYRCRDGSLLHPLDACFLEMSGGRALFQEMLGSPLAASFDERFQGVGIAIDEMITVPEWKEVTRKYKPSIIVDGNVSWPQSQDWKGLASPTLVISACILDALLRTGWEPTRAVPWEDSSVGHMAPAHTFLIESALRPWSAFWFRLFICWEIINCKGGPKSDYDAADLVNALIKFPHMANLGDACAVNWEWGQIHDYAHARYGKAEWFPSTTHRVVEVLVGGHVAGTRLVEESLIAPVSRAQAMPFAARAVAKVALCLIDSILLAVNGPKYTGSAIPANGASDGFASRVVMSHDGFASHVVMSHVYAAMVLEGGQVAHAEALLDGLLARATDDGGGIDLTCNVSRCWVELAEVYPHRDSEKFSNCTFIEHLYTSRCQRLGDILDRSPRPDSRLDALARAYWKLRRQLDRIRQHRATLLPTLCAMRLPIASDLWPSVAAYATPNIASESVLQPNDPPQFHPWHT